MTNLDFDDVKNFLDDLKNGLARPFDFRSPITPSAFALVVLAVLFCIVSLNLGYVSSEDRKGINFHVYFGFSFQSSIPIYTIAVTSIVVLAWLNVHVLLCFLAALFRDFGDQGRFKLRVFFKMLFSVLGVAALIFGATMVANTSVSLDLTKPAVIVVALVSYVRRYRRAQG